MTVFPHDVLGYPLLAGHSVTPRESALRVETGDGPSVYRPTSYAPGFLADLGFLMTVAQGAYAQAWLRDHRNAWFQMTLRVHQQAPQQHLCHLVGPPTFTVNPSTGGYDVSMRVEATHDPSPAVRPLGGDIPNPTGFGGAGEEAPVDLVTSALDGGSWDLDFRSRDVNLTTKTWDAYLGSLQLVEPLSGWTDAPTRGANTSPVRNAGAETNDALEHHPVGGIGTPNGFVSSGTFTWPSGPWWVRQVFRTGDITQFLSGEYLWRFYDTSTKLVGAYTSSAGLLAMMSRNDATGPNWVTNIARVGLPQWVCLDIYYEPAGGAGGVSRNRAWVNGWPSLDQEHASLSLEPCGAAGTLGIFCIESGLRTVNGRLMRWQMRSGGPAPTTSELTTIPGLLGLLHD